MNIVVDAGGLIAADRRNSRLAVLNVFDATVQLIVPACVIAQVWRDGRRKARLARFIKCCEVVGVAPEAGPRLGMLLAAASTSDVVDATVVDVARDRRATGIITSDPDDITRLVRAAGLSVEILTI